MFNIDSSEFQHIYLKMRLKKYSLQYINRGKIYIKHSTIDSPPKKTLFLSCFSFFSPDALPCIAIRRWALRLSNIARLQQKNKPPLANRLLSIVISHREIFGGKIHFIIT